MVITATLLVVLVGIAALAIDLSLAMAERRDAQNAADHAALSAAWAHCASESPVDAANESVVSNGYTASQLTLTNPDTGQYGAAVASTSGVFFAKIWSSADIAVATSSVAECQVGGGSGYAIQTFGDIFADGDGLSGRNWSLGYSLRKIAPFDLLTGEENGAIFS